MARISPFTATVRLEEGEDGGPEKFLKKLVRQQPASRTVSDCVCCARDVGGPLPLILLSPSEF